MKKHFLLLSIVLFISITRINSQTIVFEKFYDAGDTETAKELLCLPNDEVLITGTTTGDYGTNNIFLMKIDSAGELIWQKTYGGIDTCGSNALCVDQQGNIIIGGYLNGDAFLLKVSQTGDSLWSKTFPAGDISSSIYAITLLANNEIVIVNGIFLFPITSKIQKIDTNGNVLWTTSFGSTSISKLIFIQDEGLYFSGTEGDLYLYAIFGKLDITTGNTLLYKKFTSQNGRAYSMDIIDDNVFLGGAKEENFTPSPAIIKTDKNGSTAIWYETGLPLFFVNDLTIDNSGRILFCSNDMWEGLYFSSMSQEGDILGTIYYDEAQVISETMDYAGKYLYFAGGAKTGKDRKILVLKIDIDSLTVNTSNHTIHDQNLLVFPNPASDFINVTMPLNTGFKTGLWDNTGQKVDVPVLSNGKTCKIPVKDLKPGVYYISVRLQTETFTKKVIISH